MSYTGSSSGSEEGSEDEDGLGANGAAEGTGVDFDDGEDDGGDDEDEDDAGKFVIILNDEW